MAQTVCFRVLATVIEIPAAEHMVFNGGHFDCSAILLCVRWYLAGSLTLRNF
jgi:transposase-like protein